jgi:hypothetical protein
MGWELIASHIEGRQLLRGPEPEYSGLTRSVLALTMGIDLARDLYRPLDWPVRG